MVTVQLKGRELLCDDLTFCDDQLSDCSDNPAPDYAAFLQHTFNIFKNGLDRDLYRQEQELTVSNILTHNMSPVAKKPVFKVSNQVIQKRGCTTTAGG